MRDYEDIKSAIASVVLVRRESGVRIVAVDEKSTAQWLFDFRALLLQPQWLNRYAEIFWSRYADQYPFQVCGMETAGISLVAAIVMKGVERGTPVNGLFIRKSRKRSGLMKTIEGTPTGEPVILVDDLINSGKTFDKQLKILGEASMHVTDIFALLAFRDFGAYVFAEKYKVRLFALFTLADFGLPLLPSRAPEIPKDAFDILWHSRKKNPSHNFVVHKSSPVTDDKRVYFGSDAGILYALDQSTGDIVWEFRTGRHPDDKGIFSSPVLADGTLYFGAYDGNVYALDAETGNKKWAYSDADWVGSSPIIAPDAGLLFIGLEFGLFRKRGGIVALSLADGKKVWEQSTREYTHGSPLFVKEEDMVVIGSNDGVLYAYEASNGALRWTYATKGDIKMRPAYDPKRRLIIANSMDGNIYVVSAPDGTPVFARATGAGIYSTPLVHGDTLYVSSLDKCVYAIDLATFKDRWEFATSGRIFSSPVIENGSLWIGSNDGRLYELDPANGKLRGFFQATERVVNPIAYDKNTGRIFLPTCANEMYCLKGKRKR